MIVRDLGSRNGTLVNDERVIGERELAAGDHLKVGPLEFEVLIVRAVAGAKLPKVNSIKEAAARTAAGRGNDNADVAEWIAPVATPSEPEPDTTFDSVAESEAVAEGETRELEASETEEIDLASTMIDLPPPSAKPAAVPKERPDLQYKPDEPEPAQAEDVSDSKVSGAKPGKLPFRPRPTDSRAAANDVLKKFFNRR